MHEAAPVAHTYITVVYNKDKQFDKTEFKIYALHFKSRIHTLRYTHSYTHNSYTLCIWSHHEQPLNIIHVMMNTVEHVLGKLFTRGFLSLRADSAAREWSGEHEDDQRYAQCIMHVFAKMNE